MGSDANMEGIVLPILVNMEVFAKKVMMGPYASAGKCSSSPIVFSRLLLTFCQIIDHLLVNSVNTT